MALKRVRVIVSGRVQGVFFRANTVDMARGLGVNGWVRNCYDGTVEALFQGEEALVDKAVSWCHKGPPSSLVTDVKVYSETPSEDEFQGFSVRY